MGNRPAAEELVKNARSVGRFALAAIVVGLVLAVAGASTAFGVVMAVVGVATYVTTQYLIGRYS